MTTKDIVLQLGFVMTGFDSDSLARSSEKAGPLAGTKGYRGTLCFVPYSFPCGCLKINVSTTFLATCTHFFLGLTIRHAAGILDRKFQVGTVHFVLFSAFVCICTNEYWFELESHSKSFIYAEIREGQMNVRKKQC